MRLKFPYKEEKGVYLSCSGLKSINSILQIAGPIASYFFLSFFILFLAIFFLSPSLFVILFRLLYLLSSKTSAHN